MTDDVGNTTKGVTDGAGKALGGATPQVGNTITDTGEALSDLVKGLDGK